MAFMDLRDELNCSICLNIFSDPVLLSCGHNFCRVCIGDVLDTQDGAGVYTCPDCRAEFRERPALQQNRTLNNIAERFLTLRPDRVHSGVSCTYCVQSPVPASKTCLHCEASLCHLHLSVHSKSIEHVLSEPISSMKNIKCFFHKEMLRYYCPQDSVCVCVSCCLVGVHRGHQVHLLKEAMEKKKGNMKSALEKMTLRTEETDKRVRELQQHKIKVQDKAAGLTERVTLFFQDYRKQLEALEKLVLSEISRQKEQISRRVSDLVQQLKTKMEDLFQKMNHLEDMCKQTDPLTVLQDQDSDKAVRTDTRNEDDEEKASCEKTSADNVDEFLASLVLNAQPPIILANLSTRHGFRVPEASDILLDVNMSNSRIIVSRDLKSASLSTGYGYGAQYGKFPKWQVLSSTKFVSGQHYWKVEFSKPGPCRLGVSYCRKEQRDTSYLGNNNYSWGLQVNTNEYLAIHNTQEYKIVINNNNKYSAIHNTQGSKIGDKPPCNKFGIFLDYDAGRLSFYELCVPVRHLHTFTVTFTEPLYAAFVIDGDASVTVRS